MTRPITSNSVASTANSTAVTLHGSAPSHNPCGRLQWLNSNGVLGTHPGQVRPENEDQLHASQGVYVVADGMGGHEAGEVG